MSRENEFARVVFARLSERKDGKIQVTKDVYAFSVPVEYCVVEIRCNVTVAHVGDEKVESGSAGVDDAFKVVERELGKLLPPVEARDSGSYDHECFRQNIGGNRAAA